MSLQLQSYITRTVRSMSLRSIYLSSIHQRYSFSSTCTNNDTKEEKNTESDLNTNEDENISENEQKKSNDEKEKKQYKDPKDVKEIGGPKGPEPTRYGDWEKGGRVTDF
mmetsp:Transcript_63319/g.57051  ORF Transcript_63319/g.57051 Transcript_63319/m.57051 type:complete len:109 (+) Transcript_63319:27-353(+)